MMKAASTSATARLMQGSDSATLVPPKVLSMQFCGCCWCHCSPFKCMQDLLNIDNGASPNELLKGSRGCCAVADPVPFDALSLSLRPDATSIPWAAIKQH